MTDVSPPDHLPRFTPQEEDFLRTYSETKLRAEAMVTAGFATANTTITSTEATQQLLHQAAGIIARAEQMTLSALASAIGADKIVVLARLWELCHSASEGVAVKAIPHLLRAHGLWVEGKEKQGPVAIVLKEARSTRPQKPTDLPFTLKSGDYRVFTQPERDVPRETPEESNT